MQDRRTSFLVRVWQEPQAEDEEQPQWRASVELADGEETYYFQDVESLIAFLHDAIEGFEHLEAVLQSVVA